MARHFSTTLTLLNFSIDEHERILDQTPQRLKEPSTNGAVDGAMVAAHGYVHLFARHGAAILWNQHIARGADGEDANLRRVDDRSELVDAEHSEVRNREGRTRILVGLELSVAGGLAALLGLARASAPT